MPKSTHKTSYSYFYTPNIINPPSSHLEATPSTDTYMTLSVEAGLALANASIPASPTKYEKGMPLSQAEQQAGEWSINGELL